MQTITAAERHATRGRGRRSARRGVFRRFVARRRTRVRLLSGRAVRRWRFSKAVVQLRRWDVDTDAHDFLEQGAIGELALHKPPLALCQVADGSSLAEDVFEDLQLDRLGHHSSSVGSTISPAFP